MRRLIVNADDFGRSSSINRAVIEAHQRGILTTASLMVNGAAAAEAVELARQNPKLGVGLHLALSHGKSALPQSEIPDLVDADRNFSNDPVAVGVKYFFKKRTHTQLDREIVAQFDLFKRTRLPLDHVNGHLHFHLHPTIFKILIRGGHQFPINQMRLTRDSFLLNAKIARGRWLYRISHSIIFGMLSRTHRAFLLDLSDVRCTQRVFGLLQDGHVDEEFILRLLERLPEGDSELYSHPSLDEFKHEYDALLSPLVRNAIERLNIKLIRYADL